MKFTIRNKLLLCTIIPIIFFSSANYILSISDFEKKEISHIDNYKILYSMTMDGYLEEQLTKIDSICMEGVEYVIYSEKVAIEEAQNFLRSKSKNSAFIYKSFYVFEPLYNNGRMVVRSPQKTDSSKKTFQISTKSMFSDASKPWYQAPKITHKYYWSDFFFDPEPNKALIGLSYPITKENKFLGVFCCAIDLQNKRDPWDKYL